MIKLHDRHIDVGNEHEYNSNLTDTLLDAIETGVYTLSFNLGNSRNCTRKRVDMEDLVMSVGLASRFPIIIFSVLPSMYNLCGNRKFLAWNGNDDQNKVTLHTIKEIEYELYTIAKLGGSVISELGSYRDKNQGIESTIKSINNIKFKLGYKLVLINSMDTYLNIGVTLHDLKKAVSSVDKHSKQYISIGLNLSYLYTNGIYDLSTSVGVDELFDEYDNLFDDNKHRLSVVLLSDCQNCYGSKKLVYEKIGSGKIWNSASLCTLVDHCKQRNIAIITKTTDDMEIVREVGNDLFGSI